MTTSQLSFKCRRCRRFLFGGDSILTTAEVAGGSSDELHDISVWYLSEEIHPDWVQNAIDEAHWTKGKLNCPKCQGRLGSFDFISPNKTQLSGVIFSPIQVIKNRVDCESTSPIIDRIQKNKRLANQRHGEHYRDTRISTDGSHPSEDQPSVVISSFAEATASIGKNDNHATQDNERIRFGISEQGATRVEEKQLNHGLISKTVDVAYQNLSQGYECFGKSEQNMEHVDDVAVRRRLQAGCRDQTVPIPPPESNHQTPQTYSQNQTGEQNVDTHNENTGNQISQRLHTERSEVDDSLNLIPSRQRTSVDNQENTPLEMQSSEVDERLQFIGTSFDGENSASWEEFFEEIMEEMQESRMSSGQTDSSSLVQEGDSEIAQETDLGDAGESGEVSPNRPSGRERAALRRERNRRKKERRKQRRKEKWMESQEGVVNVEEQEPNFARLLDVLGTDWSRQALQEVTTCSICLDVFYQPHSCVPCNHIFCEPCLRQLASVHPVVAPCPLCRTSIHTVVEHYELTAAIKKLFPTQVQRRREAERRTLHRSFPLPGHSSLNSVSRPWFTLPRFRTSSTNERVTQFTSRVNRARQRRQELNRTFIQELSGETAATLMFFAVTVAVIVAFLSLMQEFA